MWEGEGMKALREVIDYQSPAVALLGTTGPLTRFHDNKGLHPRALSCDCPNNYIVCHL